MTNTERRFAALTMALFLLAGFALGRLTGPRQLAAVIVAPAPTLATFERET